MILGSSLNMTAMAKAYDRLQNDIPFYWLAAYYDTVGANMIH
jgi:hypothetical protein